MCIPPNPRRVGYIDPIHGPLDGPLYMGSHIHQHFFSCIRRRAAHLCIKERISLFQIHIRHKAHAITNVFFYRFLIRSLLDIGYTFQSEVFFYWIYACYLYPLECH